MSTPNPPHTLLVEAFLNGAWTDITADAYQRSNLAITRGASAESGGIQPGTITGLVLDDRIAKYAPGNPQATHFGKFIRGLPLRVTAGGSIRNNGEIHAPNPRQNREGTNLTVEVTAAGLLSRLGLGADPVASPPRSYLPGTSAGGQGVIGYWPMEDGALSTAGAAVVGEVPLAPLLGTPQGWGEGTLADWLPPVVLGRTETFSNLDAEFIAKITRGTAAGKYAVEWLVNGNASHSVNLSADVANPFGSGFGVSFTQSISSLLVGPPAGSGSGSSSTAHTRVFDGKLHHVRFTVEDSGSDAVWTVHVDGVLEHSGTTTAVAAYNPQWVRFNATNQGVTGSRASVSFGHVILYYFTAGLPLPSLATAVAVAFGRVGETAGDRIARIAAESGVTLSFIGSAAGTRACGPQPLGSALEVMRDAAKADGGLLRENRTTLDLVYHTRTALYNQAAALALTYTTNHHLGMELVPTYDDQVLRNDVTVIRELGGESRVEKTTGPLATAAYPNGVGRYRDSDRVNVLHQAQATDHAGFRVLVGTWTDARHPLIRLDLNVLPLAQRANALLLEPGSRVTIASPPMRFGPDLIDLMVAGIKETINRFAWTMDLICVPYGPFTAGTEGAARAATNGTTVWSGNALTTTTTTFFVQTPTGPQWVTTAANPTMFPFDILIGGERMTVTSCVFNSPMFDQFTVTRSVNGVVKSHAGGAPLRLFTEAYWGV